jgi:hypothetical protein
VILSGLKKKDCSFEITTVYIKEELLMKEFYKNPSELFNFDQSNVVELVKDVIDELDFESLEDRNLYLKMKYFLKHPEMWDELKEMSVDRVCDSDTIWDYITSYSISELGDMDGIWNEFGDILLEVIEDYFENYFKYE